jgi:uncharacterized protein YyaL (SSP411 family)
MSRGEIYDNEEGGFFRYATRPDWSIPHYEKMLGLNAGLIGNYAAAYLVFRDDSYRSIFLETVKYCLKYLWDERSGVFFGTQDADEAYYTGGKRKEQVPPYVDRTVYTDLNAQMITAFVAVYSATGDRKYLDTAKRATDFLIKNLYSEKDGMYHYYSEGAPSLTGLLSDNVLFGLAMIDLYNITGEKRFIEMAGRIAGLVQGRFYARETDSFRTSFNPGFVNPSITGVLTGLNTSLANYRTIIFLSRMYYLNKDKKLKNLIDRTFVSFSALYHRSLSAIPLYGTALRWGMDEPVEIKIVADGPKQGKFLAEFNRVYIPDKAVALLSLKHDREIIEASGYPLETAAYVCSGKLCTYPIFEPERVKDDVNRFFETIRKKAKGKN